jgi:AraC-like DNA-binding protein
VLFTYGPGVRHRIVTDRANPLVKYFVDFAGKDAAGLMRRCGIEPGTMLQTSSPNELIMLFDDLIRNGTQNTRYSAKICALLLEHLALKIAETAMPLGAADTQAFATYQRCRQHIQERFMSLATLEQTARECSVNAAYLCRLFRRFDNESPYQFLTRMKMGRAAELLQVPGAMVKQVAEDMGFDDQFHFSRTFRHVFGVPPNRFITLRAGQRGLFLDSGSAAGRLQSVKRTADQGTKR